MIEIIWKPELHSFNSCQEFADEFRLCETDLILTNEYIYQPYFPALHRTVPPLRPAGRTAVNGVPSTS